MKDRYFPSKRQALPKDASKTGGLVFPPIGGSISVINKNIRTTAPMRIINSNISITLPCPGKSHVFRFGIVVLSKAL